MCTSKFVLTVKQEKARESKSSSIGSRGKTQIKRPQGAFLSCLGDDVCPLLSFHIILLSQPDRSRSVINRLVSYLSPSSYHIFLHLTRDTVVSSLSVCVYFVSYAGVVFSPLSFYICTHTHVRHSIHRPFRPRPNPHHSIALTALPLNCHYRRPCETILIEVHALTFQVHALTLPLQRPLKSL